MNSEIVGAPSETSITYLRVAVQSMVSPIQQKFYLVTKQQFDFYSELGWLTNIFLMLTGAMLGGSISCWAATKQTNLSTSLSAVLATALYFCLVCTVLFLGFSFFFILRRKKIQDDIFKTEIQV